jgi:hypothetical protein
LTRSLLLLVALAVPAVAQSPAAAVEAAAADLARVRADRRPYTRYLSLYAVAGEKALKEWDAVVRFWANSLSREPELAAPRQVAAGLWRLDLDDYRWDAKTWEKLADAGEPYFTLQVVKVEAVYQDYGYYQNGVWYRTESRKVGEKKRVEAAAAPWTPAREALYLREQTGSAVPVVRADWWLYQTSVAIDRKAGYYDWLGLGKKEADFQALVGADVKKAAALRKLSRALVARSGVTLNNRAMFRAPAITGGYWVTSDFARSAADKNSLRLLDPDIKADASEQYGTLPNGLFAFWLQNADGARQDTAPDSIASDGRATGTDRRVHVGLSCVRCHAEGIRPINDWSRKVYKPPFALEDSLDYKRTLQLRAEYLGDLERLVKRDQADYAEVLAKLNGLTPEANAKAVAAAWDWYAERDRTAADLAAELGVTGNDLLAALKAEAGRESAKGGKIDPLLAGVVQGVELRVEHLEELFALANEILDRHRREEKK